MRPIKFRAWVKHTIDNRWNWAYKKADERALTIEQNNMDVKPEEEDDWREEYLSQWDKEHNPEDQYTITNKMVYVEEVGIYLNGSQMVHYGYDVLDIMQFTGLHDKNGKEIYEGDILKLHQPMYTGRSGGYIEFSEPLGAFVIKMPGAVFMNWENKKFYEVIGNIYENPELLKGVTHDKPE